MPLLAVSLLLSGAGQVLCVGVDGRAAFEPANPLIECAADRCGDKDSRDVVPRLVGGADCVDLFIAGLQTVRTQRSDKNFSSDPPQPLFWLTPRLAGIGRSVGVCRWLSQTDLPNLQEARSLRSVIMLI